jgi:hypothetical protein
VIAAHADKEVGGVIVFLELTLIGGFYREVEEFPRRRETVGPMQREEDYQKGDKAREAAARSDHRGGCGKYTYPIEIIRILTGHNDYQFLLITRRSS